ncbi:BON domain-containing protein [Arthrobacter sp. NPDC092385]|uniref:BON domain-containing protein n=1 Tax=Arthrobacter sp. NPDC092385 TaxID=3363943 RepID=UPI003824394D
MDIPIGGDPTTGGVRARGSQDPASLEEVLRCAVRRAAPYAALDLAVNEGTVVLSGMVPTPEERSRAGLACWCEPTVRAVYNNLEVTSEQG